MIIKALLAMVTIFVASAAQTQPRLPTQDEIISRARDGFKNAKTKEAVEGVRMWCTDSVRALDFKSRDQLMVEAIKMMEAGKIADANAKLKKVGDMEELADNLAKLVCKPERQ